MLDWNFIHDVTDRNTTQLNSAWGLPLNWSTLFVTANAFSVNVGEEPYMGMLRNILCNMLEPLDPLSSCFIGDDL